MKGFGRVLGLATELGITMGFTAASLVVVGLLLGRWLDHRFGIAPFGTMVFLIAGAVAGQIAIYRLAMRSAERLSGREAHPLRAQDALAATRLALGVLLLLSVPGLVGLVFGIWISRTWGGGPLITFGLMIVGLAIGFVGALRLARLGQASLSQKGDQG